MEYFVLIHKEFVCLSLVVLNWKSAPGFWLPSDLVAAISK